MKDIKKVVPLELPDYGDPDIREVDLRAQWGVATGRFGAVLEMCPISTKEEIAEIEKKHIHWGISFEDYKILRG